MLTREHLGQDILAVFHKASEGLQGRGYEPLEIQIAKAEKIISESERFLANPSRTPIPDFIEREESGKMLADYGPVAGIAAEIRVEETEKVLVEMAYRLQGMREEGDSFLQKEWKRKHEPCAMSVEKGVFLLSGHEIEEAKPLRYNGYELLAVDNYLFPLFVGFGAPQIHLYGNPGSELARGAELLESKDLGDSLILGLHAIAARESPEILLAHGFAASFENGLYTVRFVDEDGNKSDVLKDLTQADLERLIS